jgi:3',5'-cyclic-AMP phosphodiesterase
VNAGRLIAPLSLIASLASGGGCTDVADARAQRDARIGQASAAGMSLRVHGGLARAEGLTPPGFYLWLQAPAVTVDVEVPAGVTQFEVIADNVLDDAVLTATTPAAGVGIAPIAGLPVHRKGWLVTPPAAGGTLALRIAPADADTAGPWRFAVFADVQSAIDEVQDIYRRMAEDPGLRFAVITGDLTETGSEPELRRFKDNMAGAPCPIYATLGNHELGTRDDLFHDHFGRGTFSFVFRDVQFTLIDTASATVAPLAYEWLADWLVAGIDRVHFTFGHIPPLDPAGTRNGAFASRLEANKLLSLFASGKVDVTFYGHVHSFYAFTNAGIPAFISGGGGAIPQRLDGIGRHYLTVDVDSTRQVSEVSVVRVD